MLFGPDGNLYVVSINTDSVARFDGATGGVIDDFIPSGSGGLFRPRDLTFGNTDSSTLAYVPDPPAPAAAGRGGLHKGPVTNARLAERESFLPAADRFRATNSLPLVPGNPPLAGEVSHVTPVTVRIEAGTGTGDELQLTFQETAHRREGAPAIQSDAHRSADQSLVATSARDPLDGMLLATRLETL
jgi:hypothetical protein